MATTVLLVSCLGLAGSVSRGGLLAFVVGGSVASFICRSKRVPLGCLVVGVAMSAFALLGDLQIGVSYEGRPVSARQVGLNLVSTAMTTHDTGALEENKEWRLAWWGDIYRYTVHGKYFITGKGYGVNLADSDGFQVLSDDSLRNPHNSHLTFLARSGVPGFLSWIVLLIVWFAQMISSYLKARRLLLSSWMGLFLFVMSYAVTSLVNAMFDPALEGPMLGIWFWSIVGLGIGGSIVCPNVIPSARSSK